MKHWILCLFLLLCGGIAGADDAPYERAPIRYSTTPARDAVARLAEQIRSGSAKLKYDAERGYLPAVLEALHVPVSSQVLVFSKTSFQRDRIDPAHPRALYFNDDVYVGFVQGGDVLELVATDPVNGPNFYTLRRGKAKGPAVERQTDSCLQCHASSATGDLPGLVVRSVYPDGDGQPILSAGTFRTDPSSPLKQRWGGWYVTGTTGAQRHMANVVSSDRENAETTDFTAGTNLTNLSRKFDTSAYPSPHGDVVAMMVLEHQTFVHNLVTRANFLTRAALADAVEMNKALGRPLDYRSESTASRINNAVEPLVRGVLFSEEAALTDRVAGTSGFQKEFEARGPRDAKGRSLRDFDLTTRMFKYPCSYLIYGESFDELPAEARERFYARLGEVLTGRDRSKAFEHLSDADRRAILEILIGTKKGLPKGFGR